MSRTSVEIPDTPTDIEVGTKDLINPPGLGPKVLSGGPSVILREHTKTAYSVHENQVPQKSSFFHQTIFPGV